MKTVFLTVETKSEPWVDEAKATYLKKLKPLLALEMESIKSPSLDRDDAQAKMKLEAEKILKHLKPGDQLILFDEGGKTFARSEEFATALGKQIERSPSRLVFLIGGAFGVHESVKEKAAATWSLSGLTFNHWIAQIAALEQLYRAMTILKRIPYHNR